MIRVGFVLGAFAQGWMGGVNYFKNLVHAIQSVPGGKIEPVLIVPPSTPAALVNAFPPVDFLRTNMLDRFGRVTRRVANKTLGRDLLMERFLRANRIDVLSHSDDLGARSSFPTAGWIGDFQHRRMPEFFDSAERDARDKAFQLTAGHSGVLLVSSEDARRDLEQFAPGALQKSHVLHFTSGYGDTKALPELAALREKYKFDRPYFHLPNQYWAHKNHRVAVDALEVLKARGISPLIISTGSTKDYRNPNYFGQFKQHLQSSSAREAYMILGMIPYEDLCALMMHSVAIINPSLFEGWSTSVEEAKSFGKKIILSDIPVHREQAPERGVFFDPRDPESLATAMTEALRVCDPEQESRYQAEASARLPLRFQAFGKTYQEIISSMPRQ